MSKQAAPVVRSDTFKGPKVDREVAPMMKPKSTDAADRKGANK